MSERRPAAPVLKWAGGKRQLLAQLRAFLPSHIDRYHEPFLGSGAVFFDLCGRSALAPRRARLSDRNADLIGTYLRVCDSTDALIATLGDLASGHAADGRAHYYRVRDEQFNPHRQQWVAAGGNPVDYPVALAAMLIYLNRTGYNGLFRLNAAGGFNVPAGRYDSPRIVYAERIREAAALLSQATIQCVPFEEALRAPRARDFVYLDPPYAPLSRTANFNAYTAAGFGPDDQQRLRDLVVKLAGAGVQIVLSNSTAPDVVALYEHRTTRAAGLRCHRVHARRAINTHAAKRGAIEELIVTNLAPRN